MRLTDEWHALFQEKKPIYLYGAGDVAEFIIGKALQDGVLNKIHGIIVSRKDAWTPQTMEDIPVIEVDDVKDKNVIVLVATSRKWSDEIKSYAQEKGFVDIRDGFRYLHVYDEATELSSDIKDRLISLGGKGTSLDMFKEKIHIMYGEKQMFSDGGRFYQSLPMLKIEGERPTDIRIETYGLYQLIEDKNVIDIGCNTGFLDIEIAERAKSVHGIEYNGSLVDIANETIRYLEKTNVKVNQGDFLTYDTNEKYDVVLLFAVHGWLDCSPAEGVKKLVSLLHENGMVVFESQAWDKGDPLYTQYCHCFEENGMKCMRRGQICDDGKTNRHWCVYYR